MKLRKVGILGGTFNPIHIGHLILAENAYDRLELDEVLIMPTGVSYLKDMKEVLPSEIRLTMAEYATFDNPHFRVSDFETKKNGNTYTNETLSELSELHSDWELYFIMGADSLFYMENWVKPDVIFEKAIIVAVPRDDSDIETIKSQAEYLKSKYKAQIVLLDVPNVDISSHEVRERVRNGASIKYYVPQKVEDYIIRNGFYKNK